VARYLRALTATLARLRQRIRDRAELKSLLEHGFDFSDMGLTRAAAAAEGDRFWRQGWGQDWEVIAMAHLDTCPGPCLGRDKAWPVPRLSLDSASRIVK
jgi:uncharacterized protein YjiS (DUF1127 family)